MDDISAKFLADVMETKGIVDNGVKKNINDTIQQNYLFSGGSYLMLCAITQLLIKIYEILVEIKGKNNESN